jgi:hypothetical protein
LRQAHPSIGIAAFDWELLKLRHVAVVMHVSGDGEASHIEAIRNGGIIKLSQHTVFSDIAPVFSIEITRVC